MRVDPEKISVWRISPNHAERFVRNVEGSLHFPEPIYLPYCLFSYNLKIRTVLNRERSETGLFMVDLDNCTPVNVPKRARIEAEITPETKFLIDEQGMNYQNESESRRKRKVLFQINRKSNPTSYPVKLEFVSLSRDQLIPVIFAEGTAIKKALEVMRWDLIQAVGKLRYRSVEIKPGNGRLRIYYPYLLLSGNKNRIEIRDAVNGSSEGGQIKRAVFAGLRKKENEKRN
jgi:hypothetical protein